MLKQSELTALQKSVSWVASCNSIVVEGIRVFDLIKSLNVGPCYRGSVCLPTLIGNTDIYTKYYIVPSVEVKQWMRVRLSGQIGRWVGIIMYHFVYYTECRLM